MPLMTWNDKMSVGVRQLDDDHKRLVLMLNNLYDGIVAGHGKDSLLQILDGLIRYTGEHFGHEEHYFASTGYPESEAHKKEHRDLTATVLEVQKKARLDASGTLSLEVMNFLKNWLAKHIQGSDKKYGPHLNAKGVH